MIQIVITDFIMEEIVGLLDCWIVGVDGLMVSLMIHEINTHDNGDFTFVIFYGF